MAQSAAELIRIQQEVMSGIKWGDPRSKVPQTDDARRVWDNVATEIAAMQARGITPEIPFEIDVDPPR